MQPHAPRHDGELRTTDLMKVEQPETLAAPDAYSSNWIAGRSERVITYQRNYDEDGRVILSAAPVSQDDPKCSGEKILSVA
ncbi:hypothetical protein BLA27_27570 [Brucella cytisi]|uniref:Uncharacterized protein n=1 Tax=Brucella cytisi TaxID=407152 RepID=A0A1J6I5T0_9HYPH|nr:hypothetical protein BLA27_27570 [Brucella cytisi]